MSLNFYARMYDVSHGVFIDTAPKLYGIAVCTDSLFPNYGDRIDNVVKDSIAFAENNIFSAIADFNSSQGYDEIRFCLTDTPNDNYIWLLVYDNNGGGIKYNGVYYTMFGSSGFRNNILTVVSNATLEPGTKTGSYYYAETRKSYSLYGADFLTNESSTALINLINIAPGPGTDIDPYEQGGTTESGGGTGDFDEVSEPVEIPDLPTISSVDTGFITLFNPTQAELRNLSSYMWGDLFDISTWKKIFADPMDAILGLSIVPVQIPDGGVSQLTVGNISTGITMKKALSQYISVDCGTINVNEFWGAYLDYEPYTKAEIYLPYIGIHPLSVDDIMAKSIQVVYHVDILSGACCAYVKCGNSVLYSFIGQCSSSIPITGNDWTNVINGTLSIASAIGTMVSTGGASAPLATAISPALGSIASTAVNQMKPHIEKSGAMSGTGGLLGIQTPYIILTRPRQAIPKYQNKYMGYPSFITEDLGSLTGYTEIEMIHLENIPATEEELSEIETLLKNGVIL